MQRTASFFTSIRNDTSMKKKDEVYDYLSPQFDFIKIL